MIKSWLSFLGVMALLGIICGVFAFILPLESDTLASNATPCPSNRQLLNNSTTPCSAGVTANYHILRHEMQAYLNAKRCIDSHKSTCTATTIRLFL